MNGWPPAMVILQAHAPPGPGLPREPQSKNRRAQRSAIEEPWLTWDKGDETGDLQEDGVYESVDSVQLGPAHRVPIRLLFCP
jgi:hypothetical protein